MENERIVKGFNDTEDKLSSHLAKNSAEEEDVISGVFPVPQSETPQETSRRERQRNDEQALDALTPFYEERKEERNDFSFVDNLAPRINSEQQEDFDPFPTRVKSSFWPSLIAVVLGTVSLSTFVVWLFLYALNPESQGSILAANRGAQTVSTNKPIDYVFTLQDIDRFDRDHSTYPASIQKTTPKKSHSSD